MEGIIEFFREIFTLKLAEFTAIHLAVLLVIGVAAFFIGKALLKFFWRGFKAFFRALRAGASAREKCRKIQCPKCGRTLDKCVCPENKGRSCFSRLYNYKRYLRDHRRKNKN